MEAIHLGKSIDLPGAFRQRLFMNRPGLSCCRIRNHATGAPNSDSARSESRDFMLLCPSTGKHGWLSPFGECPERPSVLKPASNAPNRSSALLRSAWIRRRETLLLFAGAMLILW